MSGVCPLIWAINKKGAQCLTVSRTLNTEKDQNQKGTATRGKWEVLTGLRINQMLTIIGEQKELT